MLLSSVILVLQETLEAAFLISVLLAMSSLYLQGRRWLPVSLLAGFIFSCTYAANMAAISEWFDYVGQEVLNATLQFAISILITLYALSFFSQPARKPAKVSSLLVFCAASAVALAITREGSEILLYTSGFIGQENLENVLIGGGMGFGIGASIGALLYYLLSGLSERWRRLVSILLLAMFSGNMAAQAILQLIQADWITASSIVWNTTSLLAEESLPGKLLYALVGYEATPSWPQFLGYLAGMVLVIFAAGMAVSRQGKMDEN